MISSLPDWLLNHRVEITGAILGLLYIFFSIRQSIYTWPTGLLSSFFYIFVFLKSGFYAFTGLQVYYVLISIYGWIYWMKDTKNEDSRAKSIKKITRRVLKILVPVVIILYGLILLILVKFTDSELPFADSFITAFSIVGTWMLARKIIENWIVWIVVDILSAGLFLYQELWPTAILYGIYVILAFSGYFEWKKSLIKNE